MRVWESWQDAIEWLEDNNAGETVVCVSDWETGYLSTLKYDGRNFFVHPFPVETGAFFFA